MAKRAKRMKPWTGWACVDRDTGLLQWIDHDDAKPRLAFPDHHRLARVRVTEPPRPASKRGKK